MAKHGPMHGPERGHGPGGYQRPQNMGKTIRRLLGYLNRAKLLLVIVALCLFLSSACTVAGTFLLKPLTNNYILPGDIPGLGRMLCLLAAVYIAGALCSYIYARIMVRISQSTTETIRRDLFSKMQDLPLSYFDAHTHGELMSRYTNDIETISEVLNNGLGAIVSGSLTFIGVVVMMIVMSPLLFLVTVFTLLLMLLVVMIVGKRSRRYFAQQQKNIGIVNGYIEEMIEGQKVIKVFNHEDKAKEGFRSRNEDYRRAAVAARRDRKSTRLNSSHT